jgi:hypothetical protein
MQVQTIGLDIAKSVFQVHGVDAQGETVMRERLARSKMNKFFKELDPCLIGIEACGYEGYITAVDNDALSPSLDCLPPHTGTRARLSRPYQQLSRR